MPKEAKDDIKERSLDERNKFQNIKLAESTRAKLYSLKEAAELAGVSYKSAWGYSKKGDKRLDGTKRYPDQTGYSHILYTQDAIRILKIIRNEGIKRRGRPPGYRFKWTKRQKERLKKQREENNFYEKRKPKTKGTISIIKKGEERRAKKAEEIANKMSNRMKQLKEQRQKVKE